MALYNPGDRLIVTRDIVVDGQQLFASGETVVLDRLCEPTPDAPDAVFIVASASAGGSHFRLRSEDLAPVPDSRAAMSYQAVGSTELKPLSCMHQFSRSASGYLVCNKCGAAAPYKKPLKEDLVPFETCPRCGVVYTQGLAFCRNCGEPNIPLIKLRAYEYGLDESSCKHKYVPFRDGRVCANCGLIKFRGPVSKKYTPTGEQLFCNKCGFMVSETDNLCPNCRQRLKRVSPAKQPRVATAGCRRESVCSACGAMLQPGQAFCVNCGRSAGIGAPEAVGSRAMTPFAKNAAAAQYFDVVLSHLGKLLLAAVSFCGLIVFLSTFMGWLGIQSSDGSMNLSGWFLTAHPSVASGNFLFIKSGSMLFFSGIWALGLGLLIMGMAGSMFYEYSFNKWLVTVVACSLGILLAFVDMIMIYSHSGKALEHFDLLVDPGAGVWVFLIFGILALVSVIFYKGKAEY